MANNAVEFPDDTDLIVVDLPDGTRLPELSSFWLRDHCRCVQCYDNETYQRKQNVLNIAIDIKPTSVQVDGDQLQVIWPDAHVSTYDIAKLQAVLSGASLPSKAVDKQLWNVQQIKDSAYAQVTLNDYLCDDGVAASVVASLVRFGFAFIEKVPPNTQSTEMAVKRLFSVQDTFFGAMWTFADNKDHADTAYSKAYLGAHTDNTYFNDAAGLQVLHCIQHTGDGGESLLLDGFHALADLRQSDPDAFDRLSRVHVPSEYIEENRHHTFSAPIVRLDAETGEPEQIRYNLYDRSPMNTLPQSQMRQFYADLQNLSTEIESPANQWWFKLSPGTVMIFDNWRVLHGRSAYTGRRQMTGCYVARTEFQSVARTLGLIK